MHLNRRVFAGSLRPSDGCVSPNAQLDRGDSAGSFSLSDGLANLHTGPVQVSVKKNVQHIRAHIPDLLVLSLLILRCAFAQVTAACIDALDCHHILENSVVWFQHFLLSVHSSFKCRQGSYVDKPEYCRALPPAESIAHQGSIGAKPKYCCVLSPGESTAHHYLRF